MDILCETWTCINHSQEDSRHFQCIPGENGTAILGGIPEEILKETYEEIILFFQEWVPIPLLSIHAPIFILYKTTE